MFYILVLETIWNHEIAVKKLIQEQGTAKFDLNELEVKLSKVITLVIGYCTSLHFS